MDGRGWAFDNIYVERLWRNVKYEDVYLMGYATMGELLIGLTKYFAFYNAQRMHQSLGNKTPDAVYASGSGGGALILDKYPRTKERVQVPLRSTGMLCTQNDEQKANSKPGQRRPAACEIEGSLN
jgi:putative transposase